MNPTETKSAAATKEAGKKATAGVKANSSKISTLRQELGELALCVKDQGAKLDRLDSKIERVIEILSEKVGPHLENIAKEIKKEEEGKGS